MSKTGWRWIVLGVLAMLLLVGATACGMLGGGPTPTPAAVLLPTATPASSAQGGGAQGGGTTGSACAYDSDFVEDVTIPDGTVVAPGEAFTKIWRVRNSGTCAWKAGTLLVFVGGDALGGPASVPVGVVEQGATVDLRVDMIAPASAGTYRGEWQIQSPGGELFGAVLTVEIEVAEGGAQAGETPTAESPPTDTPTPAPAPTDTPTPVPEATATPTPEPTPTGTPVPPTDTPTPTSTPSGGGWWLPIPTVVVKPIPTIILPPMPDWSHEFTLAKKYETIYLRLKEAGLIKLQAEWTGSQGVLALIINGPGRVGYYARKDGGSPLSLSYNVSEADFAKGDLWRVTVVSYGVGTASGHLKIRYPGSPGTFELPIVITPARGYALSVIPLDQAGTISAEASWSGTAQVHAFVGGPLGEYAHSVGNGSVTVGYEVTNADLADGRVWYTVLSSDTDVEGTVKLSFP